MPRVIYSSARGSPDVAQRRAEETAHWSSHRVERDSEYGARFGRHHLIFVHQLESRARKHIHRQRSIKLSVISFLNRACAGAAVVMILLGGFPAASVHAAETPYSILHSFHGEESN